MIEDLEQAKALYLAATEGPWFARPAPLGSAFPDEVCSPQAPFGRHVPAECHQPEDAEFIAASRTLVPELIAEVERLQACVKEEADGGLQAFTDMVESWGKANGRALKYKARAEKAEATIARLRAVDPQLFDDFDPEDEDAWDLDEAVYETYGYAGRRLREGFRKALEGGSDDITGD